MLLTPLFLFSILLFVLGTMVGSFLNVVMMRSIRGENWVKGRSHCDDCGRQLSWYENIPLFSYIVLRGHCRTCRKPISISHPVVEFLTGSLFVWWLWGGSFFFRLTQHPFLYIQPIFWLIVGIILIIIFFADIRYYIIPDEAVLILTVMTLLYRVALIASLVMRPIDFGYTLLGTTGCVAFFAALWWFTKGKGMGFGDVKFMIPFGLLLGWPNMVLGVGLAFVIGAATCIPLVLFGKKKLKNAVPFGPFLVVSTVVTLVAGSRMLEWYFQLLQ